LAERDSNHAKRFSQNWSVDRNSRNCSHRAPRADLKSRYFRDINIIVNHTVKSMSPFTDKALTLAVGLCRPMRK